MNEEQTEPWRFSGGLSTPVMQLITIGKSWSKQESTFFKQVYCQIALCVFSVHIQCSAYIKEKFIFSSVF